MRTLIAPLALITFLSTALAQNPMVEPPLVSTTGTAEIRVVPDLADLSFDVEVRDVDLEKARKEQAARAEKVLAAVRAAGVKEEDLAASQITITPNYSDNQQERVETDKVRFFSVSQTVSFTLKDVKKVPDAVGAVVTAGATRMNGVTLRTSENRKHRDKARSLAIRAAKEKADALTADLGVKTGKAHKISEGSDANWNFGGNVITQNVIAPNAIDAAIFGTQGGAAFAPGTISISASVSVSFLIE